MHPKLQEQINSFLGSTPTEQNPEKLQDFLSHVSSTYSELEASANKWKNDFEEEKTELMEILQSMNIGVMIVDYTGTLFFANIAATHMIPTKEGVNLLDTFADSFTLVPIREYIQRCLKNESIAVKETDAMGKIFSLSFVPLELTPGKFGMLIWVTDITEPKLIDRTKNKFIAIASHEMRTPLAIIRGNSELLLDEPSIQQSKDSKESIDTILKNTVRLLGIVNDFLDVQNIENNIKSTMREDVDVIAVLKTTVAECLNLAQEKNLTITFDEKTFPADIPHFMIDKGRLEQIFLNIVSNAVHYTKVGGITVTVEKNESGVKIFFTDSGAGISLEDQADLFKKFGTGRSFIKTKEYGSGLGLYISSFLANIMGIMVKLEKSEVGVGSTFSVTLPQNLALVGNSTTGINTASQIK